jgi:S-phase kinase-associated protein 1
MASLDIDEAKEIIIITNDDQKISINTEIALQSNMLKTAIESDSSMDSINLNNINSQTMLYIIDYLKYHHNNKAEPIEKPLKKDINEYLCEWDQNFLNSFNRDQLVDIINAANYLNIPELLDLGCAKIASILKEKSVDEMREYLTIK